jgi:cytidylate kinase
MVGGVWCGAVWAEVDQCRKQRYKLGIMWVQMQRATRKRESVILSSHLSSWLAKKMAQKVHWNDRGKDVRTYDRMRERRQDQLSYENQNPNTYGEHLAEGH